MDPTSVALLPKGNKAIRQKSQLPIIISCWHLTLNVCLTLALPFLIYSTQSAISLVPTGQSAYMALDIMNAFLGPQGDDYDNVKVRYSQYYDKIRQTVPQDRLLEFSLKDGYEPLCEFLDVSVPKEVVEGKEVTKAFPHINETSDYQDRMKVLYQRTAKRVLANYIAKPLGLGALAMGLRSMVSRFR